jgi:hypothetical protein
MDHKGFLRERQKGGAVPIPALAILNRNRRSGLASRKMASDLEVVREVRRFRGARHSRSISAVRCEFATVESAEFARRGCGLDCAEWAGPEIPLRLAHEYGGLRGEAGGSSGMAIEHEANAADFSHNDDTDDLADVDREIDINCGECDQFGETADEIFTAS